MSQTNQRVIFAVMLLLGLITPLILLFPLLALQESLGDSPNAAVLGVVLLVVVLLVPFVFLYLAARAAVRGGIPGIVVLGSWWLIGVLAAFSLRGSGQLVDGLIRAVSLGVIVPSADGAWSLQALLVRVGSSRHFSLELPIYVLFLMGAYTGIKRHQLKIARAAEHSRLYSAWDDAGERVDSSGISGE